MLVKIIIKKITYTKLKNKPSNIKPKGKVELFSRFKHETKYKSIKHFSPFHLSLIKNRDP